MEETDKSVSGDRCDTDYCKHYRRVQPPESVTKSAHGPHRPRVQVSMDAVAGRGLLARGRVPPACCPLCRPYRRRGDTAPRRLLFPGLHISPDDPTGVVFLLSIESLCAHTGVLRWRNGGKDELHLLRLKGRIVGMDEGEHQLVAIMNTAEPTQFSQNTAATETQPLPANVDSYYDASTVAQQVLVGQVSQPAKGCCQQRWLFCPEDSPPRVQRSVRSERLICLCLQRPASQPPRLCRHGRWLSDAQSAA